MKFIEKERTMNQRETLSVVLWFFIISSGGALFILQINDACGIIAIPLLLILIICFLMEMQNNRCMGKMIKKKEKKENESKDKQKS